jgi:hypothetical protein
VGIIQTQVDIVLYWVDGSDEEWLKEYSLYKQSSVSRFRDLGTLKYVFRGIEKNMPWIRKIHFITNGQKPTWLNLDNDKLSFHTHSDIFFDQNDLPVFNSSAIEANFANISGLSEHFILFNDDMFILKPLAIERFFHENKPVDYLKLSYPRSGFLYELLKPQNVVAAKFITNGIKHLKGSYVTLKLLPRIFNKNYSFSTLVNNLFFSLLVRIKWFDIYHHPQAHLKSTWKKVREDNLELLQNTSKSKFRSGADVNQYIYRFRNLLDGSFHAAEHKDHLSYYLKDVNEFINNGQTLFDNYSLLCICEDEGINDADFERVKQSMDSFLKKHLGSKSSYEK